MEFLLDIASLINSTLRISTPLVFAAMAGIFAERSGVIDFSLEGKMLMAAFVAAVGSYYFGNPWIGLLMAIVICVSLSMLHGFASVTHKGDQVVSCVAINILIIGLTTALAAAWFGQAGLTPTLTDEQRFLEITLPFADSLREVPVIGLIYSEILSGHYVFVYLAYLSVPIVYWVVFKTSFGLRVRAVGENPSAVDTAGINVFAMRYKALAINGVLIAFAGARVIQGTVKEELPEGFQKSEYVEKTGFVDLIVERKDLAEKIGTLLSILLKKNSVISTEQNETTENTQSLSKIA